MNVRQISLLLIVVSYTACFSYAQSQKSTYTLKDLQSLASQQAWKELSEHLEDVPPSARNKEWEQLVEQAAVGLLQERGDRPDSGIVTSERLLSRYPTLKRSSAFMAKRADAGLKAFERCFSYHYYFSECNERLKTFVRADPQNLDLAFKAGKLVRLNMSHWSATPYFRTALAGRSAPRSCEDEDVRLAVLSALRLPKDHTVIADAQNIVSQLCWNELRPVIAAELKDGNAYFKENICATLKEKGALDATLAKHCQ